MPNNTQFNVDQWKYINTMFQNKIFQLDGQAFEDFFVSIMQRRDSSFKPVKASGKYGDGKNDGYSSKTGKYYQVYGPANLGKTQRDGAKKLVNDFEGLMDKWDKYCKVKEYYFVINDKFMGVSLIFDNTINEIKNNPLYKEVKIELFDSNNLWDEFQQLEARDIYNILGHIPLIKENSTVVNLNSLLAYILPRSIKTVLYKNKWNDCFQKACQFDERFNIKDAMDISSSRPMLRYFLDFCNNRMNESKCKNFIIALAVEFSQLNIPTIDVCSYGVAIFKNWDQYYNTSFATYVKDYDIQWLKHVVRENKLLYRHYFQSYDETNGSDIIRVFYPDNLPQGTLYVDTGNTSCSIDIHTTFGFGFDLGFFFSYACDYYQVKNNDLIQLKTAYTDNGREYLAFNDYVFPQSNECEVLFVR